MTGSLTVYVGGMMSGKSSRLIQEITRYADAANFSGEGMHKPLLINNALDSRSIDTVISSHSSQFKGISSRIDIVSAKKLSEVDVSKYDVVGIDEIQFFEDLKEVVTSWLKLGKHIYCAGLNGDAFQNHFGQVHTLLPICDHFEYLHAICQMCMEEKKKETSVLTPIDFQGMQASFSKRLSGSTNQVEVGAADKYIAVCRRHFDV
jgi:thymidine kinase